ncbi:MAG: Mur ligase family protein [Oscillospiraceae bacterium]
MEYFMTDFNNYLSPGRRGHLIGIGGASMSSLADVLWGMGIIISGSDMNNSKNVRALTASGIPVTIGHKAENITEDIEFVVRTAAVHDDNPEIIRAHELGIPVFERTQAWGAISRDYSNALCISGTHGKTTTTSMCTHILMAADRDPTVMIRAPCPCSMPGTGWATHTIVMEACEYYNSFLSFHPTVAVILNIEADHLDFFKYLKDVQHSFLEFALRTPEDGCVVANLDDANTMEALKDLPRTITTFGLTDKADVYAENIEFKGTNSHFDIMFNGKHFTDVTLHVPGTAQCEERPGCRRCGHLVGKPNAVKYRAGGLQRAGRRFEFKGKFNGADVYDDYAHHPGELSSAGHRGGA